MKKLNENQSIFVKCRSAIVLLLVLFSTVTSCAGDKNKLDQYGGFKGIKGEKTGFFHLEKINGRDWFINPEGNVFFPVALSHLYSGESDVAVQNIFGDDYEAYMKETFAKGKSMGFNCALGSVTSPERNLNGFVDVPMIEKYFREQNFPYAVGVILLKHPWEFVEGENLPDIFTPEYKAMIEARAKEACVPVKDDPLVMGYYYGFGAFNHSDYWVNQYLSLPAGSDGRDELIDLLIKRYKNNTKEFNKVYGTNLKQISELKDSEELSYNKMFEKRNYPKIRPTLDPIILADFEAILDHMAITLYKIGHEAIKKWDTNHLIFGSFVKEFAFSEQTWKAAAPYVDMIAPQHVNKEVSAHKMAEAAGLPILMSDDYFGWHYPGGKGSKHAGLESHDARGEVYKANLTRHLKDSKVLGVAYCCCMYDQGGNTLKKNNQNGLHDINGKPRKKLINDITEMNKQIYVLAPEPATKEELAKLDKELYDTWAKYLVGETLWDHKH